jgi:mannose-6-phosphate isomerase
VSSAARAEAERAYQQLRRWLVQEAYPRWISSGWDRAGGGFYERLGAHGPVVTDARRARVQFRQIFAFARAAAFGWHEHVRERVIDGLDHVYARYRRSDGLMRTLLGPDGAVREERALLYDQAFALLALAEAHRLLGSAAGCAHRASELLEALMRRLGGTPGLRADTESDAQAPCLANPHMHLLEAMLAWRDLDASPQWSRLAERIVDLALGRWIDPANGALREAFAQQADGTLVRSGEVEPGHLFEWAGLLLRFDTTGVPVRAAARRLAQIAEARGVHHGFAVNALNADLSVHDADARLWPQTERIKTLARLAQDEGGWSSVREAIGALRAYFLPASGLWLDRRLPDGAFVQEPSPASSFYHIIEAVSTLEDVFAAR